MANKDKLLKECTKILQNPKVELWYNRNLLSKPQEHTVTELSKAVKSKALSVEEALSIALVVGFEWNVKFDGVP